MCLRTGDSTEEHWRQLLWRQPSAVRNLNDFEDATRLYYSNEEAARYNFIQLNKLKQPVAHVCARHSSTYAKHLPPDKVSG